MKFFPWWSKIEEVDEGEHKRVEDKLQKLEEITEIHVNRLVRVEREKGIYKARPSGKIHGG